MALNHVFLYFRHTSQHHDQQVSWSQLADEQSTGRRSYDLFGLTFDPSVFKAKREVIIITITITILIINKIKLNNSKTVR